MSVCSYFPGLEQIAVRGDEECNSGGEREGAYREHGAGVCTRLFVTLPLVCMRTGVSFASDLTYFVPVCVF